MNIYHNTPIGKVPSDWSTELIGQYFDIQQGKQFSAASRKGDNVRKFLRTANIYWGKIDFTNLDEMHFSETDTARMGLKENDLLVCEGGDIGRTAICKIDLPDIFYQNHLHRLRPKNDKVVPEFFMYWMWYAWILTDYYGGAGNKTTIPNLSKAKLSGLHFAKPSKKEQIKIAYILSTLQKAIQKQEEIINTTTSLKRSLLNKLFTEGTKAEQLKQTPLGMIPESWQVVPIGSLGKVVTGSTPKTSVDEYYQPGEYDFIAPVDIGKNWIVENSQKKISSKGLAVSRPLPKNTVLAVCIGSTIGKVGLTSKELSATNQQINAIVCDEALNNPFFIYYLLNFYNNFWKEAATPSPVPILTKGQFEKILIPYTDDLQEQTLMAESLKVFEKKLKFHTNKKNIYESLFKTLLNELMTGAIRVNELDFHSTSLSLKTITA